jgi:hypothetical protein
VARPGVLIVGLLALAIPSHSGTQRAVLVPGSDHTCLEQLPDGTKYEVHFRTLKARWQDRDVYVAVKAYYKPNSGEFLYHGSIWEKEDYLQNPKGNAAWSCEPNGRSVVLLEGKEWVELWALTSGPRLDVFHSELHFPSLGEAWRYVSTHFDACRIPIPSEKAKCSDEIPLYKDLDFDFFRPERLRFIAAPYDYNPLVSAKKVGSTWEVVLKGADEPNRAMLLLDENFKLLKIRKFSASQ